MTRKIHVGRFLVGAALALTLGGVGTAVASSDDTADTTEPGGGGVACAPLAEPVTLKWGLRTGSPGAAHVWLADQFGYFADEGIEIEFETIDTNAALALLAGDQLDVASTGFSAGFFNAISRDIDVKILSSAGNYARDAPAPAGFFVRTDLIESGEVTEIADLEGMRIGLDGGEAALGNAGGYLMSLVLASGGLTLRDVTIVNVGIMDTPTAFAQSSIDATFMPGVVSHIVDEDGTALRFGDPNVLAEKSQGGIVIGASMYEDNPEVAKALLRALFRGTEHLVGDYREDETIVDALVAAGFERDTVLSQPYYHFDPELEPGEDSLNEFQEIMIHLDQIESGEVIPYEDLVLVELRQEAWDEYQSCYR